MFADAKLSTGNHFGGRMVTAMRKGFFLLPRVKITSALPRRIWINWGKLVRPDRRGEIPPDNPLHQAGARPEIWSYSIRNPAGAGHQSTWSGALFMNTVARRR